MANNYVHTSFYFDCGTHKNAAKVNDWIGGERITDDLRALLTAAHEGDFGDIASCEQDGSQVWIAMEETGDVELLAVVLKYAMDTMPKVPSGQGFQWAETCSKPRVDEFGGGACFIQRGQDIKWLLTAGWLADQAGI